MSLLTRISASPMIVNYRKMVPSVLGSGGNGGVDNVADRVV